MRTLTLVLTSAMLILDARPSRAQGIDLGGNVSAMGIASIEGAGHSPVLAGPAITFRFSRKHAIQVTTDLFHESYGAGSSGTRLTAICTLQYRHTFSTRNPNLVTFFTIGTAGGASWQHSDAYTYTQNGSWVQGKFVPGELKTFTVPARSHVDGIPPLVPVAGWGIERTVSRRVALRGDITGAILPYYAVGFRGSVGMVVRFGKSNKNVGS